MSRKPRWSDTAVPACPRIYRRLKNNPTVNRLQPLSKNSGNWRGKRAPSSRARHAKRTATWYQAEQNSGEQRYAESERKNPPVGRGGYGQSRVSSGQEVQQGAIHPDGQGQPARATGERQRHTLHQQLRDNPRPASAQGEPDGDFLLARGGAGDL